MKVIVAMSGGVDSSVSAALLQQQGFEVEGVFMKNWTPESMQSLTDCPWEIDQADAQAVCVHLGIPFRSINFEKEYKDKVVDYFLREYAAGRTPNPDVMCNKEIKFTVFLEEALKSGAEVIATGHYAKVVQSEKGYELYRGLDSNKDQSYFLYTLTQEKLAKIVFPLSDLTKPEVRRLAAEFKLPVANKKDSQGICFIGHLDLKKFLMEHITARPGKTFLLPPSTKGQDLQSRAEAATEIGEHQGVMFYTIGERAGQVVDNGKYRHSKNGKDVPLLYVLEKNAKENALYVTESREDPDFFAEDFELEEWTSPIGFVPEGDVSGYSCQVRYQQRPTVEVHSIMSYNNLVRVRTKGSPATWAAAEGQSLVVYGPHDEVIGGGIISKINRAN